MLVRLSNRARMSGQVSIAAGAGTAIKLRKPGSLPAVVRGPVEARRKLQRDLSALGFRQCEQLSEEFSGGRHAASMPEFERANARVRRNPQRGPAPATRALSTMSSPVNWLWLLVPTCAMWPIGPSQ